MSSEGSQQKAAISSCKRSFVALSRFHGTPRPVDSSRDYGPGQEWEVRSESLAPHLEATVTRARKGLGSCHFQQSHKTKFQFEIPIQGGDLTARLPAQVPRSINQDRPSHLRLPASDARRCGRF